MRGKFWVLVLATAALPALANAQLTWTGGTSSAGYQQAIAYGAGVFVAVGPAPQFAVSSDGINWTPTATNPSDWWTGVTYGNGTFVAVAGNGFATSTDGTNWSFTTPPNNNNWSSVVYGNGVFVTVAFDGGTNDVMTSPDGVTWTLRTGAAANQWNGITYGNGLFVAVAQSGSGNRVMTSPDGITWTSQASAADINWASVAYGGGLFVAVAYDGVTNSVMTSSDGVNWTLRTAASSAQWLSVAYGGGLFVAVAQDGISNSVMTSPDGVTWTIGTAASSDQWQCITYGNGLFVAGSTSGAVMAASSGPGYTFTGPTGGALNTASANFTVTPNAPFTGTVTLTLSGGGLSSAAPLYFTASSSAQSISIMPTAVGPVTLTPTNNGSLTDPPALTYSTPPAAPTITSVAPGSQQISVSFTAPSSNGGSTITGYSATCGGSTMSGSTSPIVVTGLTNGTGYTCTVTATNTNGNSVASSASSSTSPMAPATGYTLTGPTGGTLNTASTNFTVAPNGFYTGTITITPSGGGLSSATVLTFSSSSTAQTFTITPTALGPITLTPSNNGGLTNASALTYGTPPAAPTITSATRGNGQISVAFTANGTGGSTITAYAATCGTSTITGSSSPIVVTSLSNGTAYTCTVTASNTNGASVASTASSSVTPVAPATTYTLTGPTGGALNTVSTNFTITPNSIYSGTITITPSGGGLSSAAVLTFSNSSTAQTFTITPTAVGPVTLTPSNSGSLTDASALTYGTPPAAPTVNSVTPGNGQISVSFTANGTGGSTITGYAATCGTSTISGASSPIVVTSLSNGTSYTCTVKASNTNGASVASTASGSVTPAAPATGYNLTGPAGGALNTVSTNFTVTPNSLYSGTVTITSSGGGLSSPTVLTFTNSSTAQTFTITPTAVGPVTLTPSNNGSLTDASALTYGTPPAAPTINSATPGNGQISVAFTANGTGGSTITGYAATCGTSTISGVSSPIVVTSLSNGTAYTCTVKASNTNGASAASTASGSVTPVAPATSYTLTGPTGGTLNTASTNFTVTPNSVYSGTVTITPSGGGLSSATVLTFVNSSTAQMFTITPTAVGPVTLTPANNGGLTDASALTYGTPPAAPTITSVTPGNGQISVAFMAPSNTGGSALTIYVATCGSALLTGAVSPIVVTGLTNGTTYTCTVKVANANGTSAASSASSSVTPMAPATSYSFSGPTGGPLNTASSNFTVTPNSVYTGTITITPAGGGLSTPIVLTFSNSSTAQTFTATPTTVGPITLTPTNSGALTNASALTYGTPPATPTLLSVTPGNGQVSVAFTANATGGSTITGFAATCGTTTITGGVSPIVVTSLANGTAYTCTVTATNANGSSVASGASSPVTPVAPANSYSFSGPTGGVLNVASANFTVTPNSVYTGTVTVTPSGGGLSTPVVLTFNNSSVAQTFTITPTAVGPVILTPANNGSLTNAPALMYGTPPAAPTISSATPGNAQISVAFTANGVGGSAITGYAATCGTSTISGSVSPIVVTGLTNGTAYTCTATATNANGTSAASGASSSVTPIAPASSFTLSGPTGGALNVASTNFTVTPNSVYTGTITITPSGGGLSAPVVLTFNNSSTAQTFTVIPSTVGPVTLTPANSGSLTNAPALIYGTPPAAPTVISATAANAQISVAFTANGTGGSAITGYAATCGTSMISGSASPIVVTGLTNGTGYTCTVVATNANGNSAASGASSSVTPVVPASSYTFTGPPGGALNIASTNFTVTPNAIYSGTVTITPSGGGLSTPIVLTFSSSSTAQTFTITPTSVGPVTLMPSNSGSLTNPQALAYGTPPATPTITSATAGNAQISVAFSVNATGGSAITGYVATCGTSTVSGSANPIVVTGLTNGTAYTCTVIASNANGNSVASTASSSVTPVAPASSYTLTGPAGGALNSASSNFTITPNAAYSGTVTITPSGGGLSTPVVLTFSSSSTAQTFTITPTSIGPVGLTPTNSGSLTNAAALTYGTPPASPTITSTTAGNAQISVAFTANGTGGSAITGYASTCGTSTITGAASPIVVTGLTNGTAYTCTVKATNANGTSMASTASISVTPVAPASSYTFTGPAGGGLNSVSTNFAVTPNAVYNGTITITPSGGGLSTPVVLTFNNSSSAQTFTVTPNAVGPVSLTPANNGSLTNPGVLTYSTPPSPPTVTSASMGNGQISVAFTAPASTGGSPITGYAAKCGGVTASGGTSPIIVPGLTNGTGYTCTVTATNANGTSALSAASNSVTPAAPATSYSLSGPLGGVLNSASSSFSVTPNSVYTGTVTIAVSGGGLSASNVLTFNNSSAPQTFNITPISAGPVTLTPSNSGYLTNPAALPYNTPPAAPYVISVTPGNGQISVAFLAAASGGSPITSYSAHCFDGITPAVAVGQASPIRVTGLTNGTLYTCTATAYNVIGASAASSASSPVSPTAPATSYTLTGPIGGPLNSASAAFIVTPNSEFTGTITVTPSGGGLSAPKALLFSNSSAPQTFTVTPVAVGPVTLTAANSGSLANPQALSYATPPAPPLIGTVTTGNGSASLAVTGPAQTGGLPVTSYQAVCNPGNIIGTASATPVTVNGLATGTVYACTVAAVNAVGISAASASSSAFVPGVPGMPQNVSAARGTNQATVSFSPPPVVSGEIVTGYQVVANPSGVSMTGTNSPITITGLANGIPYTFSVSAMNDLGAGPAATSNTVVPAGPPGAPLAVAASAGNGQATVSFSAPADNGGLSIVSYTVVSNPGGISTQGSASPIIVSGLSNGTSYTFAVVATNAFGSGLTSSSSNRVTPLSRTSSPLTLSDVSNLPVGVAGVEYPHQVLVETGGAPPYVVEISAGSLPSGLTLLDGQLSGTPSSTGYFPFAITVTDAAGNAASSPASIIISPPQADLILSQGVVSFTIAAGSQGALASANVTVRSSDVKQQLGFATAQSPAAPWLALSGNGTTPGAVSIGLSQAALTLTPGTYQSTVTATCMMPSPCAGATKTVPVTLNVTSDVPAITLTDNLLKFASIGAASGSSSQITGVQNSGGGSLALTSVAPADGWLSVGKVPSAIGGGAPIPLMIAADSHGLPAGLYSSSIMFSSSAGPASLPVQLLVSEKPLIQLMPAGSQFNVGWRSQPGNPQGSFLITAGGGSSIQWQASLLPGASWLKILTPQGSASATSPGTVNFSVDPSVIAGNPAQAYYGVIRLSSDDAANSPVDFEVVLNVLNSQITVQPEPNPTGLFFSASNAGAQTISIGASSDIAIPYQVSASTQDGGSWLNVTPAEGSASSNSPGQSIVSVASTGLAPGIYRGGINYAFSGQAIRTVSVAFVVGDSSSCNPNQLIATQVGLPDNFQQSRGWPAEVAVTVTTGCGAPVTNAQASASFSNGDESFPLSAVAGSTGRYVGTWIPHSVSPQAAITVTAARSGLMTTTRISGQVIANNPPVLAPNGVIPVLSHVVGGALTQGAPVEIYGSDLAIATLTASGDSYLTQLGGTTVMIGGIPAPLLYVSPGQINALVPPGLAVGTQYQVQVNVNGRLSATEIIELGSLIQ